MLQMTLANLDKPADDDGIELDAQLEWEHEEGKPIDVAASNDDKRFSSCMTRPVCMRLVCVCVCVFSLLSEKDHIGVLD